MSSTYPVTVWYDPSERLWTAWFEDFGRGPILGVGKTLQEAIRKARELRKTVILSFRERGIPIPEPGSHWNKGVS